MTAVGRRVFLVVATAIAALVLANPADAKFPFFTVEIQPANPTPGQPAHVVVRTWRDADHTQSEELPGPDAVPNLFCIAPAGTQRGSAPHCDGEMVSVTRTGPATYEGAVTFPSPGHWEIVPFPGVLRPIAAGYPQGQVVQAGPGAAHHGTPTTHDTHAVAGLLFAGALLLLLAIPVFVAERRRRHRPIRV